MKNPQKDNGFTGIANELMDALCKIRISGEERQVLDYVFRMTYGYNRKSATLHLADFVKATGIKKQNALRAIKRIIEKNLVIKNDDDFVINKDYSSWKPLSKKITKVIKNDDDLSSKMITPIYIKKIKKKEILTNVSSDKSLNGLIKLFEKVNPNYELIYKNTTQRAALQRQVDKFTADKIHNLLIRLPEILEDQYAPRITTPVQLEAKMGTLILHLKSKDQVKTISKSAVYPGPAIYLEGKT